MLRLDSIEASMSSRKYNPLVLRLEKELAFFDRHRAKWLDEGREGQWAVVHNDALLGFYATLEEGFEAGVARLGPTDFLVKELRPTDRIERIPRAFWGTSGRARESEP